MLSQLRLLDSKHHFIKDKSTIPSFPHTQQSIKHCCGGNAYSSTPHEVAGCLLGWSVSRKRGLETKFTFPREMHITPVGVRNRASSVQEQFSRDLSYHSVYYEQN